MRIKMGVWEPGKADPARFDRASNLDEFVEILRKLNPGDDATIFFVKNGDVGHDIELLPVKQPDEVDPEILSTDWWDTDDAGNAVLRHLEPATDDSPAPSDPSIIPCLNISVETTKPSMWQDLYNTVTDIIAVKEWLTPDQHKVIDEEVLKVVRSHDRN